MTQRFLSKNQLHTNLIQTGGWVAPFSIRWFPSHHHEYQTDYFTDGNLVTHNLISARFCLSSLDLRGKRTPYKAKFSQQSKYNLGRGTGWDEIYKDTPYTNTPMKKNLKSTSAASLLLIFYYLFLKKPPKFFFSCKRYLCLNFKEYLVIISA